MSTPRPDITDKQRLFYKTRWRAGKGTVVETYWRANGWWVAMHDKVNNRTVQCRPGQTSKTQL